MDVDVPLEVVRDAQATLDRLIREEQAARAGGGAQGHESDASDSSDESDNELDFDEDDAGDDG